MLSCMRTTTGNDSPHLDHVHGGNGSLHMQVGLGCLEADPVLAAGLQAANPATFIFIVTR